VAGRDQRASVRAPGPPGDETSRTLLQSVVNDVVPASLRLYTDRDDWPADETARILTERLRGYYTDDPNDTTDQSVEDLLPASPADMLSRVVWITGRIPDFARTGRPRPKDLADRLKTFETLVTGTQAERDALLPSDGERINLFDAAPYQVIRLSVGETTLRTPQGFGRGESAESHPAAIIYLASDRGNDRSNNTVSQAVSWLDPLLLLAAMAELTGESEAQDARIALLLAALRGSQAESGTVPMGGGRGRRGGGRRGGADSRRGGLQEGNLQQLLASPLVARHHARRMLEEMAEKAKSDALRNAVKVILEEAPGDRMDDQEN
jgi:hypothetical protein